jgi:hypothetical protein
VPFAAGVGFHLDFAGVLVKVRYFAQGAYYRVFGSPPPGAPPSVGMSRAVISGEGTQATGARRAGYHLAADLQPFVVEEPAELLRKVRSDLAAAGIEEAGGGSASRDGGLEQDVEDEAA